MFDERYRSSTSLTFRGDTRANLDVGFLDDKAALDCFPAGTSVLGSQHPFAIRIGQAFDGNDADAGLVVAAVTRSKPHSPSGLVELVSMWRDGRRGSWWNSNEFVREESTTYPQLHFG